MIVAENLSRSFGSLQAVDDLSFQVDQGEVFGLLGPNGAGKTTTVRLLTCLIRPTGGTAYVGGLKVGEENKRIRGMVGILTENPGLYERLSAYRNLELF